MLTKKQRETLEFIKKYIDQFGIYPTLQQIAQGLNLKSISTIHQHIIELVGKKYLIKDGKYGDYKLTNDPVLFKSVPILGNIAAGNPIDLYEETEIDYINVNNLPSQGEFYALRVNGNSMIDDGIFDGDVVIIKSQNSAINGQTVVAVLNKNSTTLKRIYFEKNNIRLQPANQTMLPIFTDEVEIRGIVWEIRRTFDNNNQKLNNIKDIRTLDLFSGVGGIRLGFDKVGFRTVFTNDFDKNCKITYDLNFKESKMILEDIREIDVNDLPAFDFLLAGFPCQAFSIAGYRQGFDDEKNRGNLFFDIAKILERHKPEGFLLENVKNLKSHDNGKTFKIIEETLIDLGYHIKYKVLNSMEYGNLPQNRERIYIVGFKDKSKADMFEFPEKIELKLKVEDLLEKNVSKKYYYIDKPLYQKLKNSVTEQGKVYQWRRQYVRENKRGVCPTLTANMGTGGHNVPIIIDNVGIRKLTPRECFNIQGFPKSFKLPNISDSALYKQAGNSVSVSVIERLAQQIMKVL